MDSSSSSLSLSARDVSPWAQPMAEDDGSLSVAAGLAKEAALLYQAGKYGDCLRILNQLSQKEQDPKVLHNIAIVESAQVCCSDPKKLIEVLVNCKKRSEELSKASGEQLDVSGSNGGKNSASMREINNAGHQFSCSPVVYNDKFDISVTMFNIAVVWFHLHEYAKSFSYLDTLYQNIEPIDEGTALRICLLLLDASLLTQHVSRFSDVMGYVEKVFCLSSLTNQVDNGTSSQQQPSSVSKSNSLPSVSCISDAFHSDPFAASNTLEKSLISTLSEEAIEDESLQLLSSLDSTGQDLQKPSCISSSNDILRSQAIESPSAIDLRLKLHLYKVRFLLLTRNLKAAKREVKMAMNLARGKDYPMALYLKSQLEYTRGNHRKAIKLLLASNNHTETGLSSMYYNNLGCIYYRLGKYHTSGLFFSRALKNNLVSWKEKSPKLLTLAQNKSLLITYNCGLHSLACGRPFHAALCFQKASLIFYNRPVLWLRIAECCLMASEKGLISSIYSSSDKSNIRVNVIGKGKWRLLSLGNGISTDDHEDFIKKDDLFPRDGNQPYLSMSLAWQCLVNSLHLLDTFEAKRLSSSLSSKENESVEKLSVQSTDDKNAAGSDAKASNVLIGASQINSNGDLKEQRAGNSTVSSQNSIFDFEDFCGKENQMVRQAALANLAYVELGLGNPLKALSTAKALLKLPECSRIFLFLGTMYAAEALCLLNQPMEAAEYLMIYVSNGNNVELPYSQEDCEKWTPERVHDYEELNGGLKSPSTISQIDYSKLSVFTSPEEARGIFCASYAVNFALMGNLEQAQHFATKALSEIPRCTQAILTAIYVDLKCGKTQEALSKLKLHSRTRFLPNRLTLNSSS